MINITKYCNKVSPKQQSSIRKLTGREMQYIHGGLGINQKRGAFVAVSTGILIYDIGLFNTFLLGVGIIAACINRYIGQHLFPNNDFFSRMFGLLGTAATGAGLYSLTNKVFSINPFTYLERNNTNTTRS